MNTKVTIIEHVLKNTKVLNAVITTNNNISNVMIIKSYRNNEHYILFKKHPGNKKEAF